jgi:hypothetical protein
MTARELKPELMWPTPVLAIHHSEIDELNAGLARIVREKEASLKAKAKPTPIAGMTEGLTTLWLEYNVLNWDYPEVTEFRKMVFDGLRDYFKMLGDPDDPGMKITGISCWANILRYGDSIEVHHHDPSFASAHYQVDDGYADGAKYEGSVGRRDMGHTVYFRPGFLDRSHGENGGMASPWDADWRVSAQPTKGKLFIFPSYVRHEVRPYLGKTERISIAMDVFVKKQPVLMAFRGPRWHVPGKV